MKPTREIKAAVLPTGYAPLFADLKARVRAAQVRATLSVNSELILLCYRTGDSALPGRASLGRESGGANGERFASRVSRGERRRQVRLDGGGDEYSIDLLFYYLRRRCLERELNKPSRAKSKAKPKP